MKVIRIRASAVALAVAVMLLSTAALACSSDGVPAQAPATLYVAQAGCSDGRSAAEAANPAAPLCSIARAIADAPAGARVVVRGGTYPALSVGGSRGGYVTVAAEAGTTVSLPNIVVREGASFLRFEGLTLTGGETFLVQDGASHIQLVGSDLRAGGPEAVDLYPGASDVLIEGNRIASGGNGISFSSVSNRPGSPGSGDNDPPIRNVTIRNNAFNNIGTDAIRPANFDTLVIEGNDITGIEEDGDHADILQSVWGGDHLVFRNNFVHDYNGQGFFLKDGRVTDVTVENNVFVGNRGSLTVNVYDTIGFRLINNTIWDNAAGVRLRDVQGAQIYNNLIQDIIEGSNDAYAQTSQDFNLIGRGDWRLRGPHDIGGAPKFVNSAAGDYRLAAGSPGIDAGTSDGAPARDKACRERYDAPGVVNRGGGAQPFYDLGALEFSPASSPADSGAPWGGGCAAGGPGGSAPQGPGSGPGNCTCAAAAARPRVKLRRAQLRGRVVVLRVRVKGVCRLRVRGRATWKAGGSARAARLKPVAKRLGGRRRVVKLRRRVAPRVRAAVRQDKRVVLRLRVRAVGCGEHVRKLRPRARLRG